MEKKPLCYLITFHFPRFLFQVSDIVIITVLGKEFVVMK